MKSVDTLRELVKRDGLILEGEEFDKCLDAIEEEGRTRYGAGHNDGAALAFELTKIAYKGDDERYQFCRRVEVAANDRDDVTLFGVDYTPLPVDADGVPIHIGDVMENIVCPPVHREVTGVGVECFYGWDDGNGRYSQFGANCYRHHHAPTVEDVLREFAAQVTNGQHIHGAIEIEQAVTECAAKLRLAGEE